MPDNYKKENYLIKKIEPFKAKKVKNLDDLLSSLKHCGFQGGNLGKALDILEKMVMNDDCLTVMTLSGAMVPAGMRDLICVLMEYKFIDVLITTGANIIHDLVDTFTNGGHYIGSSDVDDSELFRFQINRVYDVFLPEDNYGIAEKELLQKIKEIFLERKIFITPSELLRKIGEKLENRSILSVAAKKQIPIFVPAFSDSEFALNLIKYMIKEGINFQFDILKEIQNFSDLIKNFKI